jgi:hypothetical protein
MKVCKKEQKQNEFVKGNLYQAKNNEYVFMFTGDKKGVCLNTGHAPIEMTDPRFWEDVTDKFCLTEI